jgi:hypothetical protein
MGADLFATSLLIEQANTPDWDAARQLLADVTEDDLANHSAWNPPFLWQDYFENSPMDDDPSIRRDALSLALEVVAGAWTGQWRNTALNFHKDITVWILAETSYGDNPTGWKEFEMFCSTPLYLSAGFLPINKTDKEFTP